MKINLNIIGMECKGCENRIKNSLELLEEVDNVICDYTKGIVVIKLNQKLDESIVKNKIENLGFKIREN
ncbi:MAG: heavy-metal-associated domain-containing protein [Clostridium sp.]|nr:heavy-metal-associated domain-containing protein [Clostridium sp.]MCM1443842.1 heavy-metal-associated domain-containing protein [Candidatus Amulumruptor caecigallinarius]